MIFIAGASGFVGKHLVRHLHSRGYKLKVLVRSEKAKKDLALKDVELIQGDITLPESLNNALSSEDFVIHLVGIIEEKGDMTFKTVHVKGTANLIEKAKRSGVKHFFYQSALGADKNSWSGYLRTKGEAEEIVKKSGLSYTIFRPSLIIGPWDGFTRKILNMLKLSPVLPIPGDGKARLQPLYINDWIKCIDRVIENPERYIGIYELGGPEHLTYKEMVEKLSKSSGHRKISMRVPMGIMKLTTAVLQNVMPAPPVTLEQLRLLEQDNICELDSIKKNFGFEPARLDDFLKEFIQQWKEIDIGQ